MRISAMCTYTACHALDIRQVHVYIASYIRHVDMNEGICVTVAISRFVQSPRQIPGSRSEPRLILQPHAVHEPATPSCSEASQQKSEPATPEKTSQLPPKPCSEPANAASQLAKATCPDIKILVQHSLALVPRAQSGT
jgi:hypothetical protein